VLIRAGPHVTGTTRDDSRAADLRSAGVEPLVVDILDREATRAAVRAAKPEVVVHEATALTGSFDLRNFDRYFAVTNRLRTEGTDVLLDAARGAGARQFVAQSFAGWPAARTGGPIKSEDDPLDPRPAANARESLAAIRHLEQAVTGAQGIVGTVLRYGYLYGPGTSLGRGGDMLQLIRRRRFPIVGQGTGFFSFCHVLDAAVATLAAIERAVEGTFAIVDDEPAPVAQWLPFLARTLGAPPPRRVPVWLARWLVGEQGIVMLTEARGASNARAKRELAWTPTYPSWRLGVAEGLGAASKATRAAHAPSPLAP
jgi:nucleoside-diphosphate-sugar epimerase